MDHTKYLACSFRKRQFFNECNTVIKFTQNMPKSERYCKFFNTTRYFEANALRIYIENSSLVIYIMQNGAQSTIDQHDDPDNTVLERATKYGYLKTVKYLINIGAKVCTESLIEAIAYDHLHIVKYFVKLGIDINDDNDYAIQSAVDYNQLKIVKYLIKCGANIYADELLYTAVGNNNFRIIKYLIKNGVIIDEDALCCAYRRRYILIAKYLIKQVLHDKHIIKILFKRLLDEFSSEIQQYICGDLGSLKNYKPPDLSNIHEFTIINSLMKKYSRDNIYQAISLGYPRYEQLQILEYLVKKGAGVDL